MKYLNLIIVLLLTSQSSFSQSFIEVCPSDNMNGTMVHGSIVNDTLYGTGFFTQICGSTSNSVAKWDGTTWIPTNIQLPNAGHTIKQINNEILIGTYVDAIDSNWLYEFDGSNLNKRGSGVYLTTATGFSELPNIYDVIEYNGQIYVCGEFDKVGSQSISGIMRWSGSDWEEVGGGLSGNIQGAAPIMYPHQMTIHNNELCVVGNFRYAGGVEVNGVAKWDGSTWSALGNGFNSTVYGVGTYQGELWVGGDFTQSGMQPIERLAKWNGIDWVTPGFGFEPTGPNDYTFVHTFLEADGGLYIAGGIKRIAMDIGTTIDCGGIIHYSPSGINTFNGGVIGNDIEAIGKTATNQLVIGGGVFGNGYTGVLDTLVGVEEIDLFVSLSPNPMIDVLTIESNEEIISLKLLDSKGRELEIKYIDNHSIDVSILAEGLYILHYRTQSSSGSQCLVKY